MKVVVNQGNLKEACFELTYQQPFELTCNCRKCKKQANLMMIVDDDEWLISYQRPDNVRIWPHDCTTVAIYLCTHCGSMRTKWNQG